VDATTAATGGQRVDLPSREELPPEAKEMLRARMARHGEEMTALMIHVLLLDYDVAGILASDLAREPKLGRPAANEKGTLNALLPARFFVHQDALAASATAVAQAAAARDDRKLVEAFSAVAKSCVGCHSTYLHDNLEPYMHQEPGEPLPCAYSDSCEEHDAASD
jgi:cytochrome c553